MQTRGSTNKSPIKLSMQWKINNTVICLRMKKTYTAKPYRVILRSPLPKFHYYYNKQLQVKESQYLILTYGWTLIPIPNWTCSVVTISPFHARHSACADHSTRLQSPTREGCWLQSSSVQPNDEDPENAWSQNPTVQKLHRVILRSALLKFHYYHNKRLQVKESQYLIPTYNWTLITILNWTCSVVTISPFNARLPVHD